MALFINGVGQDTFNMNGVSIDNLYVDGVLVWSSYVNTKPVISIIGDNPMYLILDGSAYVEQGATASDAEDGDITNDIVIGGDTPNVSVEGYYYVTYNVSDSEGLAADEQVRTVQVYVVTVPKYELTEVLINDGTFDYVPDSNNPESAFQGKLTESDGTTPYEPTALQYPQNGLLELATDRIMDTQYTRLDSDAQYGIYSADGSTVYNIWAIEHVDATSYNVYEGDQDTPIVKTTTFPVALTIPAGSMKITDERPSWLPTIDIPTRTTDTHSSAISSSGTASSTSEVATSPAWEAFDKIFGGGSKWNMDSADSLPQSLNYQFTTTATVRTFRFYTPLLDNEAVASERQPRNFTIDVSSNGTDWTTVHTVTDATELTVAEWSELYTIDTPTEAKYIRLNVTTVWSGTRASLTELELNYDDVVSEYGPELIYGGGNDNGIFATEPWTVIATVGSLAIFLNTYLGKDGADYLPHNAYAGMYQSFATEIGETYEVSGFLASPSGNPGQNLGIDDAPPTAVISDIISDTVTTVEWTFVTFDFVATETTHYLTVKSTGSWERVNCAELSVKKRN